MKEIECVIKSIQTIDNQDYYIIQNKETLNYHYVPSNQIDRLISVQFGKTYTFVEEYNQTFNKTFFNLILPSYKIGNEVILNIINRKKVEDKIYFELESEYPQPLSVIGYTWQANLEKVKCKIVGYKRGIPRLKNVDYTNDRWNIGEIEPFIIKGFSTYIDKHGKTQDALIVEVDNEEIKVKSGIWHNQKLWKFPEIYCEIIGISRNGFPKLRINDNRHPKYSINNSYNFFVKEFKKKELHSGTIITVIKLADNTDITYEVLALPNQENKLKINQQIECEVTEINTKLHLKQVNIDDPFFYEFNEIVNDIELEKKYFQKYLNNDNFYNNKFKSQYTQHSGFWVFTYCNEILSRIKLESIKRKNLTEISEIIKLHNKIEEWILNKGILRAIFDNDERKFTKLKTRHIIDNNKVELKIIEYISNFKENAFFEKLNKEFNFKELYFFIKYSDIERINTVKFLSLINNININNFETADIHYSKKIISLIDSSLNEFKKSLQQEYFILTKDLKTKQKENINKLINWLIIEYHIYKLINSTIDSNLILANILRFSTFLVSNFNKNKKLLLNAFYIISNLEKEFILPVSPSKEILFVDIEKLEENPNKGKTLNLEKEFHLAKITEKHYKGYKLSINDITGFLPYQNISDQSLKGYQYNSINWDTNIMITLYCNDFNFFVAKQLNIENSNYYSKNNLLNDGSIIGSIINGTIKNVKDFGVFVTTEYGDGLIHLSNIIYGFLSKNDLNTMFKIDNTIPVFVLNVMDNKIELSLKHLIGTKYEKDYYKIINFYEEDEIITEEIEKEDDYNLSFKIEIEKGYIFEQFALIQKEISNKIKYIKFAKAFFSNTKNARSYLLNIYIEYFNSLLKLDKLINNYSFDEYDNFRNDIVIIKDKVVPKTLENFPESKNLLFFIDILNLFNSQKEDDIEKLFNLTRKPIQENDILLKTVAKNALANNLIISEIDSEQKEELNEFTLRNLKRIRQYISQGVLSVKETIEDRLEKELKEKRVYWKNRILEDEGEKLEFKSTFITPVPNNEKEKIIANLNKKIKNESNINKIEKIKKSIEEINKHHNKNNIEKIIIHSSLKTICAFANTNGGYLLIGVSDDKKIYGLEQDYNWFKTGKDRDEFGKYFDNTIKDYFGDSFSSSLLSKEFLKFPDGDILIIKVSESPNEVFLLRNEYGKAEENLYVRNLSSSVKLKGRELAKFIKTKMNKQLQNLSKNNEV